MIDALLCRFALHAVLDDPFCEDCLFFVTLKAVVTDAPHDARFNHVLGKVVPSHPVEVCWRESKGGPRIEHPFGPIPARSRLPVLDKPLWLHLRRPLLHTNS